MNETEIQPEIASRFETANMVIGGELEFMDAVIDQVNRQPVPHWRRPTPAGSFRRVRSRRFTEDKRDAKRMTKVSIDA